MKKLLAILILIQIFSSCRKDSSAGPSPYYIGEKVRLHNITVKHGGVAPLTIYYKYTIRDYLSWYYNTVDAKGDTLTHLPDFDIRKY